MTAKTGKADSKGGNDTGKSYDDYYLYATNREEWVTVEEAKESPCWDDEKSVETNGQTQCLVTGRRVIERYLAALAGADPKFAVPDDRQIAYERVTPQGDAEDKREFWRTYFLDRAVRLTGSAVPSRTPVTVIRGSPSSSLVTRRSLRSAASVAGAPSRTNRSTSAGVRSAGEVPGTGASSKRMTRL